MPRYSSDTKVLGAVVLSILGTSRIDELQPYFQKYGIAQCNPGDYYPVESLAHMMDDIIHDRQSLDSMYDFVSMGIANGLSIPLPPEVDTLEKWLTIFESRYPTLYHGTNIGYVKCEKLAGSHYQVRVCWPWVDDIAFGMIYGMCKRFLPHGHTFYVYYDDQSVRADQGGPETIIHVSW
jgi:hypothetical protein